MAFYKQLLRRFIGLFQPNPAIVLQQRIFTEVKRACELNLEFPETIILPSDYGKGLPERVIELLFVRLSYQPGLSVLDVGHANAMQCHLNILDTLPQPRHLTGIDIAPPVYNTQLFYERSVLADIIKAPFEDGTFDLIWCVSALEHFGMDNSGYTSNFRHDQDMDILALREMLRLLVSGGNLLVTVPYGRYENHGWHRNYDEQTWQELLDVAREISIIKEWYYRHTYGDGWLKVNPEELRYVGYYDQANAGAGGLAVAYFKKRL